jgi:hypothetical protein
VARTCALIAVVWPVLHQTSWSNKIVRNALKYEFGVQWGGSGGFVAKIFNATSLHERVHQLQQFGHFCTDFRAVTKRSKTSQNKSLGSIRVDLVRSLRKFQRNFVTRTGAFIVQARPILHQLLCSNEMV